MAYVSVDQDRTFRAEHGLHHCPQVILIASTDTPYLQFDFGEIVDDANTLTGTPTVIEKDSKAITIADVSLQDRKVSFKVSGMAAGDFVLRCTVTNSAGTTNTVSRQGTLRVS